MCSVYNICAAYIYIAAIFLHHFTFRTPVSQAALTRLSYHSARAHNLFPDRLPLGACGVPRGVRLRPGTGHGGQGGAGGRALPDGYKTLGLTN